MWRSNFITTIQDCPRGENERLLILRTSISSCDFLSMSRGILKIHAILLISYASFWTYLLLIYFISASPILLYLVEGNNSRDLLPIKSNARHHAKVTKEALLPPQSSVDSSIISYPEVLSANEEDKFRILMNSERNQSSALASLSLLSSSTEFHNITNAKRQHNKLSEDKMAITLRKLREFHDSVISNITGGQHDASDQHVRWTNNISDNAHPSTFENHLSSSNTLNASDHPSLETSPLLENNSSIVSISPSATDLTSNSSNNSVVETTANDFTNFPIHSSTETTEVDPPSADSHGMSSGAIAGVVIAVLAAGAMLTGTVIYLFYQKCGKNNKLESKCPSDNCGYVDDTLRSSGYLNSHIELPKESSEEMTSLDNDSFLNSLESMTFQNYWADNTKNTKV